MSFEGTLESLPIPDIIQLLHSTGKSGTLTLRGPKGESQLVFDAGYIVSANHPNNSMRIGRVLVDMGALPREELDRALKVQAQGGKIRTPLLSLLLDAGKIEPPQAYKGLEILIQLAIVEILTWSSGTFSLDTGKTFVSDEYRYFPEQLKQKIQLNTQSVLMDALRIYDERKRDGTLMDAEFFGPEPAAEPQLSAEDLGLGDLDELETRVPAPFRGIKDLEAQGAQNQGLQGALARLTAADREELMRYLDSLPLCTVAPAGGTALLLFSDDALLRELIAAACGEMLRWAVSSEKDLEAAVDAALAEDRLPTVLLAPSVRGEECEILLRQICAKYPQLPVFLLLDAEECGMIPRLLQTGVSGVWPRPPRDERSEGFAGRAVDCLEALRRQLQLQSARDGQALSPQFLSYYRQISQVTTPPEVTLRLLRFVCAYFGRAVTFIQLRGELVAEKGIGFEGAGAVSPVRVRIPLHDPSLFRDAAENGTVYYGEPDALMRSVLPHPAGAHSPKVLLLPVRSLGRVIAVVYADCGPVPFEPPLQLMEILAQHAGLIIDNALYRKRNAANR